MYGAPTNLEVLNEIQNDSRARLNSARFTQAGYADSTLSYHYFDQDNWRWTGPYHIESGHLPYQWTANHN